MSENGTEHENTYTTTKGVTVELVGIPYLLDMLKRPNVEPPYGEFKDVTGATQRYILDEQTAQTDEEKQKLADYHARRDAANAQYNVDFTRLILMRGVKAEMPAGDAWIKEQGFMGIAVPDDPLERRWHWIQTELVGGKDDVQEIILRVLELSDVREEVLTAMADSFQHSLGKRRGQETSGPVPAGDKPEMGIPQKVRTDTSRRKKRHTRNEPV